VSHHYKREKKIYRRSASFIHTSNVEADLTERKRPENVKKQANYPLPRALAYHHRIYFILLLLKVMLLNSTTTPTPNRVANSTSTWSHPPPPMLYHPHPFSYEGNYKEILS
jgi:hypothetical protein